MRCFQILWLSHNIRTLPYYESVGPSRETYKLRILCAYAQRGQKLHEFAIDYIFMSSSRASKIKLWTYTYAKDLNATSKKIWTTLCSGLIRNADGVLSLHTLGQFNNFNKLRQYDWSKFWCFCTYIELLLRKIYFIRRKEVIGLL